jgi:hypothetical protein
MSSMAKKWVNYQRNRYNPAFTCLCYGVFVESQQLSLWRFGDSDVVHPRCKPFIALYFAL